MIEWILAQQAPLSVSLIILIGLEKFLSEKLGAKLMYQLWLLIPAILLVNNLPTGLITLPANTVSYYVVGPGSALTSGHSNWLLMFWLSGASALVGYILYFHIRIARALPSGKHQSAPVYTCDQISSPMLFGTVNPRILVPEQFSSLFNPQEQALIVKHENMHRHHYDHIWNFLGLCLLVTFWFNPFVWLAVRSFRTSQEISCDTAVLKNSSAEEKITYAKALVQCAEHTSRHVNLYPTLGDKSTMLKRLYAIKNPKTMNKATIIASVIVAGALCTNTALAKFSSQSVKHEEVNKAAPVKRVPPVYPEHAVNNEIEGEVVLQFDITESGATDNITVVKSSPEGVFDKSAVNALKQWKYKPRIQGGAAQRQSGLLVQLDFRLGPPASASNEKTAK